MLNTVLPKQCVDTYAKTTVKEMGLLNHIELCMSKVESGARSVKSLNQCLMSLIIVPVAAVSFVIIHLGVMVGAINLGRESRRLRN